MANKPVRDWVYLAVIGLQLTGMLGKPQPSARSSSPPANTPVLVLDLVAFYPPPLWMPPGAPLHFLVGLRRRYVTFTGDPFFSSSSAVHGAPWFEVFLYIEGLVQFPLAAYLVSKLASPRRMAGPAELAGLAFGCLTFMGSAACCYELLRMGADQVAAEKKTQLLYGTYLPFVVIRKCLFLDS